MNIFNYFDKTYYYRNTTDKVSKSEELEFLNVVENRIAEIHNVSPKKVVLKSYVPVDVKSGHYNMETDSLEVNTVLDLVYKILTIVHEHQHSIHQDLIHNKINHINLYSNISYNDLYNEFNIKYLAFENYKLSKKNLIKSIIYCSIDEQLAYFESTLHILNELLNSNLKNNKKIFNIYVNFYLMYLKRKPKYINLYKFFIQNHTFDQYNIQKFNINRLSNNNISKILSEIEVKYNAQLGLTQLYDKSLIYPKTFI